MKAINLVRAINILKKTFNMQKASKIAKLALVKNECKSECKIIKNST